MTDFEIHTFDEIPIGYTKNFSVKIDEEMLDNFANISGDFNPLHMDEQYAKTTQFKGRVCHGMLLTSFFSRLIGMYIPGKFSLYFSQSLNFRAPCFIEDVVTITGTVTEKHNSTKMLTLKTVISNQNENCLVDGIAKVIVRDWWSNGIEMTDGIGVDIVEICRFKKIKYNLKPSFYKKLFKQNEIDYCLKFKNPYEHFAGKFALKESVKKSINEDIPFSDIEITYSDSKPQVVIFGNHKNKYKFLASLTHDAGVAIGVVISKKLSWF